MTTKKSESAATDAAPETRQTYRVVRAFVHDDHYYAGQDVPEIGKLPKAVIEDRIERGYIEAYRSHAPAAVTPTEE